MKILVGIKLPLILNTLEAALETKLKSSLSSQYKKNLVFVFNLISKNVKMKFQRKI